MTRVRTNNVFGTITDNPLTNSATTMNSAGLADLAVVSSAEAIIILDPNRVSGAPEIVVVTAHTGSATSATIQRGQFGTSARQHAAGTEWVHGPITTNATSYATAADDQGDFVPMNAWEAYTPTWTNVTQGSGATNNGAYIRIGRTIHWRAFLKLGTSPSVSGLIGVSLPVTAAAGEDQGFGTLMSGRVLMSDATGSFYIGTLLSTNSTTASVRVLNATGSYLILESATTGVPITWAVGDEIAISGTYEAAS